MWSINYCLKNRMKRGFSSVKSISNILSGLPSSVKIVEVGARDGLQSETKEIATWTKVALVERLARTGLGVIEATSFVSPTWVPQMRDGPEVMRRLRRKEGVRYPVLTPNLRGLQRAVSVGADEVAIFASATESFSKRNINSSIAQSLHRYRELCEEASKLGVRVRGYVSCVVGCPYEGKVMPQAAAYVARQLLDMGCYEISLGDTIGVATPGTTVALIEEVSKHVPIGQIAVHMHDTYSQALSNVLVALQCGVTTVDTSVAGLGGCPYAKGATGNLATEDLVYMLDGMGVHTGVDLDDLIACGNWISFQLGRQSRSKVAVAITRKKENTLPFFQFDEN